MILKATDVSKSFPIENMEPQHVLKNIQLTINKGEFVSVMGASGSGIFFAQFIRIDRLTVFYYNFCRRYLREVCLENVG